MLDIDFVINEITSNRQFELVPVLRALNRIKKEIEELAQQTTNTGSLQLLRCNLSAPCSKRRISGLCGYGGGCYWKAQQQQAGA